MSAETCFACRANSGGSLALAAASRKGTAEGLRVADSDILAVVAVKGYGEVEDERIKVAGY